MPATSKRRRTGTNPSSTLGKQQQHEQQNSGQSTLSFRSTKAHAAPLSDKKGSTKVEEEAVSKPAVSEISPRTTRSTRSTAEEANLPTPSNKDKPVPDAEDANTPASASASASVKASKPQPAAPQTPTAPTQSPFAPSVAAATDAAQEAGGDAEEEDIAEQETIKQARKLPAGKVKAYWHAKERARTAARVHQRELSLGEKVLREWDMTTRFGPSVGVSREQRWWRAWRLDMHPPIEVLAVLLADSPGTARTSVVDELIMTSRLAGDGLAHAD